MPSPTPPLRPVDQQEISSRHKRFILVIFIIVIALALISGLIWLTSAPATSPTQPTVTQMRPPWTENQEPETPTALAEIRSFSALSSSNNLSVIDTDLESTRLNNLNAEFNAIEAVLER